MIEMAVAAVISALALALAKGAAAKAGESIYISLENKVSLVTHFTKDLRKLREDLVELSTFVKDASSKYDEQSDSFKHWVVKLYHTSLDAQLVLDFFQAHQDHPSLSLSGCHLRFRCRMGKRIRDIQSSVKELYGKAAMLHLVKVLHDPQHTPNYENPRIEGSTLRDEDTSVGLHYGVASIKEMLKEGRVVAAVGMGGIGKTRLLQHVFKEGRSGYDVAIWLSVTQNYSIHSLQSDMLSQLQSENVQANYNAGVGRRQDIILELLAQKKSCLLVLDDVWDLPERESREFLTVYHKLRRVGLPEHDNCKILISTREESVANSFKAQIYGVQLLNDEESMQLFRHHMIGGSCSEDETTVRRILGKCGGLPLAILAMAGVLANQPTRDWRSTLQDLEALYPNSSATSHIMNILGLSYKALPYQLKRCFASLSICIWGKFWEMRLIGLWKAQGLVSSIKEGRQVTEQLISRSLLQLDEDLYGRVIILRHLTIHDLVRDMASCISMEMRDLCRDSNNIQQWSNARYIDLRNCEIKSLTNFSCCSSKVTTLNLSHNPELSTVPQCFLKNATSLKVFVINHTSISKLPDYSISGLKLLKYLDLKDTKIKAMPECIRRLNSLEFLFLPEDIELPHWLGELTMLQVIHSGSGKGLINAKWVTNLKHLRVLAGYTLEMAEDSLGWNDLSTLPLMRVAIVANHESILSRGGVGPPQSLEYLGVSNTGIVCDMPDTWQSISNIDTLAIYNIRVPRWVGMFQSLRVLLLTGGSIEGCHVKGISELPRLQRLRLSRNNSHKSLPDEFGKKQSFPMLRDLEIRKLINLEKMPEMEDGAMTQLKCLVIRDCPRMQYDSRGLSEMVSRVDLLCLEGCRDDFTQNMRSANTRACLAWEAHPELDEY